MGERGYEYSGEKYATIIRFKNQAGIGIQEYFDGVDSGKYEIPKSCELPSTKVEGF